MWNTNGRAKNYIPPTPDLSVGGEGGIKILNVLKSAQKSLTKADEKKRKTSN